MGDYDNDGLDEFAFTNGYGTIQDLIIWSGKDDIDQWPDSSQTRSEHSRGKLIGCHH